jgi:hypothetical protein
MNEQKTLKIDDVEYVRKDSVSASEDAEKLDGLPYVIVRTYSAGVFAGYLKERNGKEGTILHSRRLWYWKGASSLSQLSQEGVTCPDECKFPCVVPTTELTEIIEVLTCTKKAQDCIQSVKVWEQ